MYKNKALQVDDLQGFILTLNFLTLNSKLSKYLQKRVLRDQSGKYL